MIVVAAISSLPRVVEAQTMHRSPHIEETANIVGLKGGPLGVFNEGERAFGGAFSPFYERNVVPGWLEIEAAMAFGWVEAESVIAFDLFAKKPFHVGEGINPYVGLGANLSIVVGAEETRTRAGILWTAGSYFWFRAGRWGLDVEAVYLLLFAAGLTHEVSFEVGPVFRF